MRANIVDPGSAGKIISRKAPEGNVLDVIGLSSRLHEPIGACYVASYAKLQGHDVKVIIPKSSSLSIEEILCGNPEVVAFSTLTYNYPVALDAARRIKEIDTRIATVIGGYHATCLPTEISTESAFDYVVAREADWTLSDLLDFLSGKREKSEVRGIVYQNGEIFANNFRRFNPNDNPIPFRTKEMIQMMKRYGLYYPAPSDQKSIILLVGSRGCDYGCKFCLSSSMFPSYQLGSRTRFRDIDNIINEITDCQERFGTNYGFFVDLNFYGGDKTRIEKLCTEIARTGFKWYAMSRIDVEPEILRLMHMGGCTQIGFGIESMTKHLKSGFNGTTAEWHTIIREKVALMRELGMLSKGYFIIGDHADTRSSLEEERKHILETGFDELRISFMMYSPGTPMFNQLATSEGFVTDDLSLFSTDYPVIRVTGMSPSDMLLFRNELYRDYYTSDTYRQHADANKRAHPELTKSYKEFNEILKANLGKGFE